MGRLTREMARRGDVVATQQTVNLPHAFENMNNLLILFVPQEGFEPPTPSLRIMRSTDRAIAASLAPWRVASMFPLPNQSVSRHLPTLSDSCYGPENG
jgi:hypothetical protein